MGNQYKIGIHANPGSASDKWIAYCKKYNIPFKLVNCCDSDIIEQLHDCYALMWHHHHTSFKEKLFAKQLLFSVEHSGKKVFPNFNTAWHFDDKVGQKYLLEALDAPLVPSYVFYTKKQAMAWAKTASYPKVFKLRGGAGSSNVRLVRNHQHARSLIRRAFHSGFLPVNRWYRLRESMRTFDWSKQSIHEFCVAVCRTIIPFRYARTQKREKGYVYFQDFIANNDSDLRVIIVGNRAFAAKRLVRKNDFRASGSGVFLFEADHINLEAIKIAFQTARKMGAQSLAFDFVFDEQKKPLIVEMSYGFCTVYDRCIGYWTEDLVWVDDHFSPQDLMISSVLSENSNYAARLNVI